MDKLKINRGIKEIPIEDEKGNLVTVLRINTADSRTIERFTHLIQNLDAIVDEAQHGQSELEEKYDGVPDDDMNMSQIIDYCGLTTNCLERCCNEIDAVFGPGTIHSVFSECYDVNPDFIPDENALTEFIDGIMPIMNEIFQMRFDENRKNYNSGKRGKRTK